MLSYVCFLLVFTVTFKLFLLQKVPSIANEQDTSMKSHENPNENLNEIHFGNCKNMIILWKMYSKIKLKIENNY